MYKTVFAISALLILAGPAASQTSDLERFPAGGPPGRNAPFSDAVRVGDLLFVSGKLGTGQGGLVEGGIAAETRQALENIKASLERYGSSMDRVVKCLVMIDDMAEWPAMNEVYAEFFPGAKPARSAFGADGLALGAGVEIECMATVG